MPQVKAPPEVPRGHLLALPPENPVGAVVARPARRPLGFAQAAAAARRANPGGNIARYNDRRAQQAADRRRSLAKGGSRVAFFAWALVRQGWKCVTGGPASWLLVVALVCPAAYFPQLSRSVVAGANVLESVANMTANVASTAGALTSVTTSLAVGSTSSVLGLAHDFWKGIDVHQVQLGVDQA